MHESQSLFLAAGLKAGELCIWILGEGQTAEQATVELSRHCPKLEGFAARRQVEFVRAMDWYFRGGQFDQTATARRIKQLRGVCRDRGWEGIRVTGGLLRLPRGLWKPVVDYDCRIDGNHLRDSRVLALCLYHLGSCPIRQMNRLIGAHDYSFVKKGDRWEVIRVDIS